MINKNILKIKFNINFLKITMGNIDEAYKNQEYSDDSEQFIVKET